MQRRLIIVIAAIAVVTAASYFAWRRGNGAHYYTGIVEGEGLKGAVDFGGMGGGTFTAKRQ